MVVTPPGGGAPEKMAIDAYWKIREWWTGGWEDDGERAEGAVRLYRMVDKCPKHRTEVCADRQHDAEHGEQGFRDECLRANPDGAEWIAMIDVDEFLYPAAGTSLPAHLAAHCAPSTAYAVVRWLVLGTGGRRPVLSTLSAYTKFPARR